MIYVHHNYNVLVSACNTTCSFYIAQHNGWLSKFPCFSKCFAPGSLLFSPLGYYPPVVANGNKYANLEIG